MHWRRLCILLLYLFFRFIGPMCSSLIISSLIFCLDGLSVVESGRVKSHTVVSLLSVCTFRYVSISLIYLVQYLVHIIYMNIIIIIVC